MFKLAVFLALIIAACARPDEFIRARRSPHHLSRRGIGLSGSIAQADSSAGGFGLGSPGGYGGYGGYPGGYGGYPGGYGGYGGYPGGYGGYPGGYGGYPGGYGGYGGPTGFGGGRSDASAQASSFGIGLNFRRR